MYVDDPRRRLQVLNQANPSLRMSAAPQLRVTTAAPQKLNVELDNGKGQVQVARDPNARAAAPENVAPPPQSDLSFIHKAGQYADSTVDASIKPFAEGITRLLPGGQADVEANQRAQVQNDKNMAVYSDLYKSGKIDHAQYVKYLTSGSQNANDIATEAQRISDTADRSKIPGSALQVATAPFLGAERFGGTLAQKALFSAAEGAGLGISGEFSANANPTAKGAGINAALGGVLGGAVPFISAAKRAILPTAKSTGIDKDVLNYLQQSDNPNEIASILKQVYGGSEELAGNAAQSIATSGSKRAILKTLQSVAKDAAPAESLGAAAAGDITARQGGLNRPEVPPKPAAEADTAFQQQVDKALQDAQAGPAYQRGFGQPETPPAPGNPEIANTPNAPNPAKEQYQADQSSLRETGTPTYAKDAQETIFKQITDHVQNGEIVDDKTYLATREKLSKDYEKEIAGLQNKGGITAQGGQEEIDARYKDALDKLDKNHERTQQLLSVAKEDTTPPAPAETQAAKTEQAVQAQPEQSGTSPAPVAPDVPGASATPNEAAAEVGPTVDKNADQAAMPQKVEEVVPNGSPKTQKAVQDVMDSLDEAKANYDTADKSRSIEKASRAAQAESAYQAAGGGEAGMRAKLAALRGKYTESGFNPITVDDSTQQAILNDIQASDLRPFEKTNTQNAIRKIWGATEDKPRPSDIEYLRKYFGNDMADAVQEAIDQDPKGWRDIAAQAAGTPRALMATADLSFGFRQGAKLGSRYVPEWASANKESVKYALDPAYYDKSMADIKNSDYYNVMNDKMKVALTGANENAEEAFAGADFAEKIPLAGHVVSASDRAYTGGLTNLRYNVTKKIIDGFGGVDEFMSKFSDKEMSDIGEVINTLSGRGGKAGGLTEKHMKTLSTTLFAPRLWTSNINFINPYWYARLSPEARKIAVQSLGTFSTMAGTVLGLAAAAGATVIWDPRSADFAKIKIGNTRYDIMGGLQQNIRLVAQAITGQKINSETGEMQTLGPDRGYGKPSRYDLFTQAIQNKENPLLSFATTLLKGTDAQGKPINLGGEILSRLTPLNAQQVVETSKDVGNPIKGTAMALPGFLGFGVQTYGSTPSKDTGTTKSGEKEFTGKVKENMVTGPDGKVILDKNGAPITADFPKDATTAEKKALLDEKKKSALTEQFKQKLSSEDQALMKLDDTTLKKYVKDGTIDQSHFDKIKQYQKGATTYGKDAAVPDNLTSDQAKNFYTKWNSMNKKDQDWWLKNGKPDDNAKSVADALNKQKPEGLSDFKPTNGLSKAYAEYEKDLVSHPEYTDIDKQNKAKAFNVKAAKLNYNTVAQDIYAEGGSADLKALMEQDKVNKDDLASAIQLDNELYASGLTGTLKFSKKFRNQYGLGSGPSGSGGGSVGSGGGSGGSTKEVNAHLASLLPSFKTSTKNDKPEFSSKPRGISFKTPSTAKGVSNNKKITIKL